MSFYNINTNDDVIAKIAGYKANPKNVPVFSEAGNYYILGKDLESYMETALIDDAIVAMNNIAESLLSEGASVTPDNLIVIGYVEESNIERLDESGVLLELKFGQQDITKLGSNISAFSKKIVNKVKGVELPSSTAHKQEAARLKKVKEDAQQELKDMNENGTKFIGKRIILFFTKYYKYCLKMLPVNLPIGGAYGAAAAGLMRTAQAMANNELNGIAISDADTKRLKAFSLATAATGVASMISGTATIIGGVSSGFNAAVDYKKYLNDYIGRLDELIKYHESKAKALESDGK